MLLFLTCDWYQACNCSNSNGNTVTVTETQFSPQALPCDHAQHCQTQRQLLPVMHQTQRVLAGAHSDQGAASVTAAAVTAAAVTAAAVVTVVD
jgi:hypothetical protein